MSKGIYFFLVLKMLIDTPFFFLNLSSFSILVSFLGLCIGLILLLVESRASAGEAFQQPLPTIGLSEAIINQLQMSTAGSQNTQFPDFSYLQG